MRRQRKHNFIYVYFDLSHNATGTWPKILKSQSIPNCPNMVDCACKSKLLALLCQNVHRASFLIYFKALDILVIDLLTPIQASICPHIVKLVTHWKKRCCPDSEDQPMYILHGSGS